MSVRFINQLFLLTLFESWYLFQANHRKNTKYGRITFQEALDADKIPDPSFMFRSISVVFFSAPLDHRRYIHAAKKSYELHSASDIQAWENYIYNLIKGWSTFNLAVSYLCFIPRPRHKF